MKGSNAKLVNRSNLLKLCVSLILVLLFYLLMTRGWDKYKLYHLESAWSGFGTEEKGYYNFTVVTGLFDIGRGNWWTQGRTYNEYLSFMMQILMMDVDIIVFIEPKGRDFVERIRKGRETRTKIVSTPLEELEYYPLLPRIKEIMNSPAFQKENSNYLNDLPEGTDPYYNLVTNSKTSLVHQAMLLSKSEYFIWLDGGYGHGDSSIYPPDGIWHPRHLLSHPDKVSFIAFENLDVSRMKEAATLHKMKTAWLAGGLFAGGRKAMERFYDLHKNTMKEYMTRGTIDDDQTTFVDCVMRDVNNFRPVLGDWYDLMKPFR